MINGITTSRSDLRFVLETMPPPSDHPSLTLSVLNDIFIVQQLTISEDIPDQLLSALTTLSSERNRFISITRTLEEISIVCNISSSSENDAQLPKWRCIKIKGPMDFGSFRTKHVCDINTDIN